MTVLISHKDLKEHDSRLEASACAELSLINLPALEELVIKTVVADLELARDDRTGFSHTELRTVLERFDQLCAELDEVAVQAIFDAGASGKSPNHPGRTFSAGFKKRGSSLAAQEALYNGWGRPLCRR